MGRDSSKRDPARGAVERAINQRPSAIACNEALKFLALISGNQSSACIRKHYNVNYNFMSHANLTCERLTTGNLKKE
jgi:hypothetical protein